MTTDRGTPTSQSKIGIYDALCWHDGTPMPDGGRYPCLIAAVTVPTTGELLAVQRTAGVSSEPSLAEPTDDALVAAVALATVVVHGISPRWRHDGIGTARRAVVRNAGVATLLVHGGPRPGGLAPRASRTRFTWSIQVP